MQGSLPNMLFDKNVNTSWSSLSILWNGFQKNHCHPANLSVLFKHTQARTCTRLTSSPPAKLSASWCRALPSYGTNVDVAWRRCGTRWNVCFHPLRTLSIVTWMTWDGALTREVLYVNWCNVDIFQITRQSKMCHWSCALRMCCERMSNIGTYPCFLWFYVLTILFFDFSWTLLRCKYSYPIE